MVPEYLYHKIFGGNTSPSNEEVGWAAGQIAKEGLIPALAIEWANLLPDQIRHLPVVWLSQTVESNRGVWLQIATILLDKKCLFKLDAHDVNWWVYSGRIATKAIIRIRNEN